MADSFISECDFCGTLHGADEEHMYQYADLDSIDKGLIDTITTLPLVDGVQLPCEHMFSRLGLLQWLATHNSCPTCRTPTWEKDVKHIILFVKDKLDDLLVRRSYLLFVVVSLVGFIQTNQPQEYQNRNNFVFVLLFMWCFDFAIVLAWPST